MDDRQVLEEKLNRYTRLFQSEDFNKTLDELDFEFGFSQPIFALIKYGGVNPVESTFAKEGARAYSMALRNLIKNTKQALDNIQEGEQDG